MTAANAEMPSAMASTTSTVRARSRQKSRIALRQIVLIMRNHLCNLWMDCPIRNLDLAIDYTRDIGFVSCNHDGRSLVRHVAKEIEDRSRSYRIEIAGWLISE